MTKKTSIWLALRNRVFRAYWLAALVSGTCVAAHNTAAFSVLGKERESALLISLMSTLSALPFALFTLPAGAFADMVDRKKILYGTNLWQASIAICLAILALTDLLNSYIILTSVFLFGIGFAFASPASASVEVEMVSKEDLASANTLGGLQMNIAGIIGPLIGGFLVLIAGVGIAFAANGLGFLFMLLAIVRWKRPLREGNATSEDFLATIATAIRYVHYTPGIRVILTRIALFSFFISIIPALMPVVGLNKLNLDPSQLGYLFTAMAVGSVAAAVCIIPLARAHLSPNKLIFYANILLVLDLFLMAIVSWPHAFLLVAALGGAGWTLSATELWIAGQRAMPDWARGRLNATIVMISQAATALGGVVWGSAAVTSGVVSTFLVAGVLAILTMAVVHFAVQKRLSVDFAADLNLEPAAVTIFSHNLDPMRLSQAKDNPVSVVIEFAIDPANRSQCTDLMREIRLIYLRNGARNWHLYEDFIRSNRFQMEVVASSWSDYQRQNERLTRDEKGVLDKLASLRVDTNPPEEFIRVSVDKEVVKKKPIS
ncbi:MAG TPA: MFS transporter [Terrimicrobiaceae bacterium]